MGATPVVERGGERRIRFADWASSVRIRYLMATDEPDFGRGRAGCVSIVSKLRLKRK